MDRTQNTNVEKKSVGLSDATLLNYQMLELRQAIGDYDVIIRQLSDSGLRNPKRGADPDLLRARDTVRKRISELASPALLLKLLDLAEVSSK